MNMVTKKTAEKVAREVKKAAYQPHEELAKFLKEKSIILDYEIINDRMFQTDNGFVLKPKNPLIKITARYDR